MSHDRGCHCGKERYEYDDCDWPTCTKSIKTTGKQKTMKTEQRYVVFYNDGTDGHIVTDDPVKLYLTGDINPDEDTIYELGNEVKLDIKVTPITKPATRSYDPVNKE